METRSARLHEVEEDEDGVEPITITSRNRRDMEKRADELGAGMYAENLEAMTDEEFAKAYAHRDELAALGAGLNDDFEKNGPELDSGEWGALATNAAAALDREQERRAGLSEEKSDEDSPKKEPTYHEDVLCTDCMYHNEGLELGDTNPDWDEETAAESLGKPGHVTPMDDIDDFSTDECYGCGSRMGGARYHVAVWDDEDDGDDAPEYGQPDTDDWPDIDEDVYINIDTPQKAQAAANSMYAELEGYTHDDFDEMDFDELEEMYNKYNAIDDEIRAQGDIGADETSGNAILYLHDAYHSRNSDRLSQEQVEKDKAEGKDTSWYVPRVTDDNRDELRSEAFDLAAGTHPDKLAGLSDDDFNKLYDERRTRLGGFEQEFGDDMDRHPYEYEDDTEDWYGLVSDSVRNLDNERNRRKEASGETKKNTTSGLEEDYKSRSPKTNDHDTVKSYFDKVNENPDVSTPESANSAAWAAYEMAGIQHPVDYEPEELAVKMENLNWMKDGVHKNADTSAREFFDIAYQMFSDEVEEQERYSDQDISDRAPLLSDMDPREFKQAMHNIGLDDNASLNSDGTVSYNDIHPLGKMKVANAVRDYERYREDRGAWGAKKFEDTRSQWDGEVGWSADDGSVMAYAETSDSGSPVTLFEGSYPEMKKSLGSDEARTRAQDDMAERMREALEAKYPGHPANSQITAVINGSSTDGYGFDLTIPGNEHSFTDDPKSYYSDVAIEADKAFRNLR